MQDQRALASHMNSWWYHKDSVQYFKTSATPPTAPMIPDERDYLGPMGAWAWEEDTFTFPKILFSEDMISLKLWNMHEKTFRIYFTPACMGPSLRQMEGNIFSHTGWKSINLMRHWGGLWGIKAYAKVNVLAFRFSQDVWGFAILNYKDYPLDIYVFNCFHREGQCTCFVCIFLQSYL